MNPSRDMLMSKYTLLIAASRFGQVNLLRTWSAIAGRGEQDRRPVRVGRELCHQSQSSGRVG
jgi:hypothetical protein